MEAGLGWQSNCRVRAWHEIRAREIASACPGGCAHRPALFIPSSEVNLLAIH